MVKVSMSSEEPTHRIREWRQRTGLSQSQLGQRVGRTATEISRFERGERDVYLRDLREIAEALGIDIGRLLLPEDNVLALNDQQLEALRFALAEPLHAMSLLSQLAAEKASHSGEEDASK